MGGTHLDPTLLAVAAAVAGLLVRPALCGTAWTPRGGMHMVDRLIFAHGGGRDKGG